MALKEFWPSSRRWHRCALGARDSSRISLLCYASFIVKGILLAESSWEPPDLFLICPCLIPSPEKPNQPTLTLAHLCQHHQPATFCMPAPHCPAPLPLWNGHVLGQDHEAVLLGELGCRFSPWILIHATVNHSGPQRAPLETGVRQVSQVKQTELAGQPVLRGRD